MHYLMRNIVQKDYSPGLARLHAGLFSDHFGKIST